MKTCALLIAIFSVTLSAEIVDRMVAVVEGRVITWSTMMAEANYRAFQNGQEPVRVLEGEALGKIVSQIIDQMLLEKEMDNSPFVRPPTDGTGRRELEELRKRFPSAEAFQQALARYQLSEAGLIRRLELERAILSFIDYRLRPQVSVSAEMIETYYHGTLTPELIGGGNAQVPALEEVSSRIEQVLIQREINRLLEQWLEDLRSRAKVKRMM